MKIALFSDVHANLPALEAVLDDIDKRHVDMVYCLGDLVSYAPWPNEVVELIRKKKISTLAGNHDEILGQKKNRSEIYQPDRSKSIGQQSIELTNFILKQENRKYLKMLPKHIRLDFNGLNLLLVHGSPDKIDEYLTEDLPNEFFLKIMEEYQADILCFGHTHKPFYKKFVVEKENQKLVKHSINLGSVGKPKDGNPDGCYVILSIEEDEHSHLNNIVVEFIRIRYDVEKTAKAIEESPLPSEFADMIRKAY